MIARLLVLLFALMASQPALAAYAYYRTITIDKDLVPSDQTDFPVLVAGTYTYLKTVGNGGNVQNASGFDIGFFSDEALTTPLDWEVETWSASTGVVAYWVRVPSLSSSVDTVIYLAYGDSGITTDQSDPAGVWDSDYKGVWHLGDGTTLSTQDSTSNNNDWTYTGSPTAAAAKIDGGGSFNGSSQHGNAGTGIDPTASFTVSAWANADTLPGGSSYRMILEKGYDGTNEQFAFGYANDVNTGNVSAITFYTFNGATHGTFIATSGLISTGTWYHLVGTFNGSAWKIYVNGAEEASTNDSQAPIHTARSLFLAASDINGSTQRRFDGILDDARISTGLARSADWILTEYNSQNDPALFYAIGSETPTSGFTPARRTVIFN